jgi:hypothetical protein
VYIGANVDGLFESDPTPDFLVGCVVRCALVGAAVTEGRLNGGTEGARTIGLPVVIAPVGTGPEGGGSTTGGIKIGAVVGIIGAAGGMVGNWTGGTAGGNVNGRLGLATAGGSIGAVGKIAIGGLLFGGAAAGMSVFMDISKFSGNKWRNISLKFCS